MSASVLRDIPGALRHRETVRDLPLYTGTSLESDSTVMACLQPQYARPLHKTPFDDSESHSDAVTSDAGQRTPRAEDALRRKTPNGTINAGYDGGADHLQPQKHQLLLRDTIHDNNSVGRRTFLQHQRARSGYASLQDRSMNHNVAWSPTQYGPQTIASFGGMDSMLDQMNPQYLNQMQYHGLTVPSVIQPSFQYLGPTASGGQGTGPYGPYWHDGTFVPYRPTAVRDPRFYYHSTPTPPNWPQWGNPALPTSASWHPSNAFRTPWPVTPSVHRNHTNPQLVPLAGHPFAAPAGHLAQPAISSNNAQASVLHQGISQPSAIDHGCLNASVVHTEVLSSEEKKDQAFVWALQQYRDLLTFIHHTRRQQHTRPINGQAAAHQPTFFPKPPKGSATRAVAPGTQSADATLRKHGPNPSFDAASSDATIAQAQLPEVIRVPASAQHPRILQHRADSGEYGSSWQTGPRVAQPNITNQARDDSSRTLRRSSGSLVSSAIWASTGESAPERAATALSNLSQICQGTDWQWSEGMHLCGCLAYGLGRFDSALSWYNKVLDLDPKHLEATSNLAATLLALGRKQEAEQHWSRVVKAAPNHFEAVEHLVGLFCNTKRSRDAIRVIEYVERCLQHGNLGGSEKPSDRQSECSSSCASRSPCRSDLSDKISYDFETDVEASRAEWQDNPSSAEPGFGSSGFAIPGSENGRILALVHAKGNMLYGLGDNTGAARAFEDAVMIAAGRRFRGVQDLVHHILAVVDSSLQQLPHQTAQQSPLGEPILLTPEQALATAKLCFPYFGELPGLQYVMGGTNSLARRAIVSTTSNSLLSLAKIYQDGMSNASRAAGVKPLAHGVRDVLALYYLSLSLQPSPSTANNVGILLASVQQSAVSTQRPQRPKSLNQTSDRLDIPGVLPGSGIALALQYYNYGLQLDQNHAHLYTNLGSLLKDIGQLDAAIELYERAVKCDGKFDIALANLANAVKDKGRISDAITYYRRAVDVSPDFAEAVCGLANALNSVCGWEGRGGIAEDHGKRDRWHVDAKGMLLDARHPDAISSGWIRRVVDIVEKQLVEGQSWGSGSLTQTVMEDVLQHICLENDDAEHSKVRLANMRKTISAWAGQKWEGARVTRLVERATRRITWQWYRDLYVTEKVRPGSAYLRPQLPSGLSVPPAPTVLPFHTFTCPMSAKQIRLISQRNGLRISVCTLRLPWLPKQVYPPPRPPAPVLHVGYVSSDFNNHPLAHLMQSVFGLHDKTRVKAYCYATTASDHSVHRQQIQAEAPVFWDVSNWSTERLVNQVVNDGIHILVNLNGYTRGARNEVFAARPAPIQMSLMGFAGTLGAEWCDYLLADETAVPPSTLRPWRRNVDLEDDLVDETFGGSDQNWVYGENIIYCRDTFFCCDHRQSAPDAQGTRVDWKDERSCRWAMRKELFPQLSDETIIFGNFNQLYKIDPTTFRTWLRILARVPNSVLWLLRFPDLGESRLQATARLWAGPEVASRVIFTDVAPKHLHISRARVCDLVLDTAECNAHTTAADVLWSGTPLLTLPRYGYKMCSRMAASILKGALPKGVAGQQALKELVAETEEDYEDKAVSLAKSLIYVPGSHGDCQGRLMELRRMLFESRWSSALFDTQRWVRDLEDAYSVAWKRWVNGEGGDIWLDQIGPATV